MNAAQPIQPLRAKHNKTVKVIDQRPYYTEQAANQFIDYKLDQGFAIQRLIVGDSYLVRVMQVQ